MRPAESEKTEEIREKEPEEELKIPEVAVAPEEELEIPEIAEAVRPAKFQKEEKRCRKY